MSGIQTNFRAEDMIGAVKPAAATAPKSAKTAPAPKAEKAAPKIEKPVAVEPIVEEKEVPAVEEVVEEAPVETEEAK